MVFVLTFRYSAGRRQYYPNKLYIYNEKREIHRGRIKKSRFFPIPLFLVISGMLIIIRIFSFNEKRFILYSPHPWAYSFPWLCIFLSCN